MFWTKVWLGFLIGGAILSLVLCGIKLGEHKGHEAIYQALTFLGFAAWVVSYILRIYWRLS